MAANRRGRPGIRLGRALGRAFLAMGIVLMSAGPFAWMVSTSLKTPGKIQSPNWIPDPLTWENYERIFTGIDIGQNLANSLIVALLTTATSLALAASASYSLSRWRFRGRRALLHSVLTAQMIPSVVLVVPLIVLAASVRVPGSERTVMQMAQREVLICYGLLIFLYSTFALPFCLWMLKSFFDTIPRAVDECALVDGCTPFGAFVRVILPLSAPGLVAAGIFAFLAAWNEYLFALAFIQNSRFSTMPLALTQFMGQHANDWGAIMAASTVFTFPALLFFVLVQKRMTVGLVSGAVKE